MISTPSANEIITYDFLQQYVEANGGGNGIAEFNQVLNYTHNNLMDSDTLPSGGSYLVLTCTIRDAESGSGSDQYVSDFSGRIVAGGTVLKGSSNYTKYITAIKIS